MDGMRFARLARVDPATPTRRGLTAALAGLSLAGGLGSLLGSAGVAAKKKKPCALPE
jgi:hypothetical protein